jgi:hypothetical protein
LSASLVIFETFSELTARAGWLMRFSCWRTSWRCLVRILAVTEFVRWFSLLLQASTGIEPLNWPRPLCQ